MSTTGRPLRFLGRVCGGWMAMRVGAAALPLIWQGAHVQTSPMLAKLETGRPGAIRLARALTPPAAIDVAAEPAVDQDHRHETAQAAPQTGGWSEATADGILGMTLAFQRPRNGLSALEAAAREPGRAEVVTPTAALAIPGTIAENARGAPSRWSAVGWLLWRPDAHGTLAQGPLLGGSQVGARLDYRLTNTGNVALYGRYSRAIDRPFADEAAVGLSWRPVAAVPVALLAERRQKLGAGGRTGFAVLATGGIGPTPVAPRLLVEGYAQAGVVAAPDAQAFADGRLSLGYSLTPSAQRSDLALGASLSGSAQPGAARVDVGPELGLRLPVASGHLRLSAGWRERIAGDARPSSGPALTLVTDF